jgi:O-acetylhomoserine (thiol)-lyase
MSDEDLKKSGIAPGTVRLSIGLEDAQDLIDDLEYALKSASRI